MEKEKLPPGRPEVFTESLCSELEQLLKLDYPLVKIGKILGFDPSNFYKKCKRDAKFEERMSRAKRFAGELARATVIKSLPFNPKLALRYLELKERDEFNTKQIHEHENPIPIDLTAQSRKSLAKYNPNTKL